MKKTNILIVEDDVDQREFFARYLASSDQAFHIDFATDSNDFERLFAPKVHECVVLDYMLPGRNGLQLLGDIVAKDAGIPVILVTGHGSEKVAVEALRGGAFDYVVKEELGAESFLKTVQNAVEHSNMRRRIQDQELELKNFARILSHDLKSPLFSLTGLLSMFKEDLDRRGTSYDHSMMTMMLNSAYNATDMISALNKYAVFGQDFAKERVAIREILDLAVFNLTNDIEKRKARIDIQCPEIECELSKVSVVQLVQNLIDNAIRHNESVQPVISIVAEKVNGNLKIVIKDNGVGIREDKLKYIFEPFVKGATQRNSYNLGLGLTTCQRIVERHDGYIAVETTPNEGSVFTVTLTCV